MAIDPKLATPPKRHPQSKLAGAKLVPLPEPQYFVRGHKVATAIADHAKHRALAFC